MHKLFFHDHIKPESQTKLVLPFFQTKIETTQTITPQAQNNQEKPQKFTTSE